MKVRILGPELPVSCPYVPLWSIQTAPDAPIPPVLPLECRPSVQSRRDCITCDCTRSQMRMCLQYVTCTSARAFIEAQRECMDHKDNVRLEEHELGIAGRARPRADPPAAAEVEGASAGSCDQRRGRAARSVATSPEPCGPALRPPARHEDEERIDQRGEGGIEIRALLRLPHRGHVSHQSPGDRTGQIFDVRGRRSGQRLEAQALAGSVASNPESIGEDAVLTSVPESGVPLSRQPGKSSARVGGLRPRVRP
jgi:hypothetical protein